MMYWYKSLDSNDGLDIHYGNGSELKSTPQSMYPLNGQKANELEVQHEDQDDGGTVAKTASEEKATIGVEAKDDNGELRYPFRNRKAAVSFRISALAPSRDEDEPIAKEAIYWGGLCSVEVEDESESKRFKTDGLLA